MHCHFWSYTQNTYALKICQGAITEIGAGIRLLFKLIGIHHLHFITGLTNRLRTLHDRPLGINGLRRLDVW